MTIAERRFRLLRTAIDFSQWHHFLCDFSHRFNAFEDSPSQRPIAGLQIHDRHDSHIFISSLGRIGPYEISLVWVNGVYSALLGLFGSLLYIGSFTFFFFLRVCFPIPYMIPRAVLGILVTSANCFIPHSKILTGRICSFCAFYFLSTNHSQDPLLS